MSTREWGAGRAAARRRAARSLGLLLLVSGAAVGSAHGVPTASPPATGPDDGSAATRTVAPAATAPDPAASPLSLTRWATALTAGHRPGVGRPFRATPPIPTAVPDAALAAYHRAAAVLAVEAPSCALDWSVLAAIGHVESDHGRRAVSTLGSDGVSRPGIVGPAIDVPGRRSLLPDTDGGDLDGTDTEDRAVGALQLLPSAWSAAAVDGDADGLRNPQDVDDASLAAGVLLCTSSPTLGSEAGLRQALRHYNPAHGYVDTVRRLAAAYAVTDLMAAVVATAIDVVAGPALLERVPAAPEAPAVVPDTSATPAVPPSARETVPASARPVSASATADPQETASASAMPSPVSASIAADATSPSAGPAAPPSAPPSQQADDPPSVTAAGADPQPDPAPEPEPTRASDPGPEPSPEPTRDPDPGPEPRPEPTRDPAPEPTPSRDPAGSSPPSSEPGAGESAAPETSTAPDLRTVSGVWSRDGGSFLLDGTGVGDVDALGDLAAPAPVDLDGDGATETVVEELTGLAGRTVEVRGIASPGRVAPASLDDLRSLP